MKKILPIILGVVLIVTSIIVFVLIKSGNNSDTSVSEEDVFVPDLPESQWPIVSLIPTDNPTVKGSDGHWLNFKVEKINVPGAVSMDYELVYNTDKGNQQGVPGMAKLNGTDIERKLLLGSESSGKYRYDTGVETGSMTIKFRNTDGKLIGKLTTEFHLQSNVAELSSVDGNFKYTLDKIAKDVFFVTMKTFASPDPSVVVINSNGYSIFASDSKPHSGK